MAKKSTIEKNERRKQLAAKHAARRQALADAFREMALQGFIPGVRKASW